MFKTYDSKSFDLAEHFLEDYAERVSKPRMEVLKRKLACQIQEAIEDWLSDLDRSLEPVEPFPSFSAHGG